MVFSLTLRRIVSSASRPVSNGLQLIRSVAAAPPVPRLFNTNAVCEFDDEDDERHIKADRLSCGPHSRRRDDFFSDAFDPFSPTRSLSQVLNLMDQFMDNPFVSTSRGISAGVRRGWDARETDDALNLCIDMPGLGKEDVKLSVEQNTLIIKGEGAKELDDDESRLRYISRIDLPEKIYRTDQIKAEMKNGVLKVVVQKIKEEDRADVIQVKVE